MHKRLGKKGGETSPNVRGDAWAATAEPGGKDSLEGPMEKEKKREKMLKSSRLHEGTKELGGTGW